VIDTAVSFIHILATVLIIAIIIRALMSWFMPQDGGGGLSRVLLDITEPILAPIRRILPPVGGIDFSPILAMILIQLVSTVLAQLLQNSA
jgi:YggT family protein